MNPYVVSLIFWLLAVVIWSFVRFTSAGNKVRAESKLRCECPCYLDMPISTAGCPIHDGDPEAEKIVAWNRGVEYQVLKTREQMRRR